MAVTYARESLCMCLELKHSQAKKGSRIRARMRLPAERTENPPDSNFFHRERGSKQGSSCEIQAWLQLQLMTYTRQVQQRAAVRRESAVTGQPNPVEKV